jgi:uncharacterized membrane protein HdeD (DUF308 family)
MNVEEQAIQEIGSKWGWFLGIGILLLVLGIVGLGATFALTLTTVTFFGILILIGSVFQLIDAFQNKGWALIGNIIIALLYGAVGYIMVANPALASSALTMVIAWALIFIGIMRMVIAFRIHGVSGWVWTLISGIAAIVLGIMILNNWPVSGLWVIGMFVAIELIFNGWRLIMLGIAAKSVNKAISQV